RERAEEGIREMEPRLVSVVLVTWNSARYLRRCLEGILQQTHDRVELIAVDNASADDSIALVAPHATTVIRNHTNRGFSAAVNQAIAVARGEYLLIVNPDCYLLPDYAARLVAAFASSADLGSATGLLIRARGTKIEPTDEIDSMGIRMTRNGRHLDIGQGERVGEAVPRFLGSSVPRSSSGFEVDSPTPRNSGEVVNAEAPRHRVTEEPRHHSFEVFGVSGAAAMFRTSFLQDVAIDGEVLDEDFFAYREDADLAWRGRLFGWRALCDPAAVAHHVRRVTPEARRELPANVNMHSVKNRFLLRLKNQGAYLALRNLPFELARDLVVVVAALTIERTSLPAFPWLWRNRRSVLAKRRAIQRRRKLSDRELARWFA
ncbi:MAG TPA: glycosyltransferase, partial [Thermoanaerobaculia bacterium]|nr:glycosyltransferase [Thermoanaerobaculia bacterium]